MRAAWRWVLLLLATAGVQGQLSAADCPLLDASGCCDTQCKVELCSALYDFGAALVSMIGSLADKGSWNSTIVLQPQQCWIGVGAEHTSTGTYRAEIEVKRAMIDLLIECHHAYFSYCLQAVVCNWRVLWAITA